MGIRVGIDLGTTFSAVAWVNPHTRQPEIIQSDDSNKMITPSEIWFSADGNVYYGALAKEAFETGEEGVANTFKRYMGTDEVCFLAPDGREYTAEELSAMLLKYLKEQTEKYSGQTIDEAVITVPAYFEDEPRKATRRAAQAAGLRVQDIISEPTAAALNYGLGHWRQNALIMVYDLGGGTFDVTLVGMTDNTTLTTLGTTGDHRKGGRDWDEELVRLVIGKVEDELGISLSDEYEVINDIRSQAEEWKKQLSQVTVIRPRIRVPGSGYAQVSVSRAEFDEATAALLNQTASLCESLLNDLHVTWSQITDVLLVGGSTRMPQVAEFLTSLRNGREPIRHVNPDYAVALGAAMRANMTKKAEVVNLTGGVNAVEAVATRNAGLLQSLNRNVRDQGAVELSAIHFQDAVAHAMGIVLVNEAQTAYINETIIPANAPVPCKFSRPTRFDTLESEMEIFVLQGSGSIRDAQVNAKYVVSGIKRVPERFCAMHVQYSYDSNHIIHIQARQDESTVDLPIRKEPFTQEDIEVFLRPYQPPEPKVVKMAMTIVMALDVSGSMSGRPLQLAKDAMTDFTRKFPDVEVSFGVLAVSDKCSWVVKPTRDLRSVRSGINSITCGMTGYGNAANPFPDILNELRHCDDTRYAIVLADGMWNNQSKAVTEAHDCHKAGIDVIGMGFGSADKKFMKDISSVDSVMTTDTQLGASFGKIAQSISGGSMAVSGKATKKGIRGLFGKKEAVKTIKPRSWETPAEMD